MARRWFVALVLCCVGPGCSQDESAPGQDALPDLAADATLQDQGNRSDGGVPARLDFVVQGCEAHTSEHCVGKAPLRLTLLPVGDLQHGSVASWDLGDGSKQPDNASVTHLYRRPGTYTITLTVGHGAGTVSERKHDFVVVSPAAAAGACELDADCDSGECVCTDEACAPPLSDGFCLQTCDPEADCPEGSRCVDLAHSGSVAEPWRGPVCVRACEDATVCGRAGFVCQEAPTNQGWRPVCLPVTLGAVGDACLDADGAPSAEACLGGLCLAIGSAGYCSMSCDTDACPPDSACVQFRSVGSVHETPVCLRTCGDTACDADPLLSCEQPDERGDYGFGLHPAQEPSGEAVTFCAPRRCSSVADDCGIGGQCDLISGGFCLEQAGP